MDKLVHETPDGACVCAFVLFFSHSVPHCTLLCACAVCNVQVDKLVHETPDAAAHAPTVDDLTLFTTTMLDSFYNFATSFATSRADAVRMCHHQHPPPPLPPPPSQPLVTTIATTTTTHQRSYIHSPPRHGHDSSQAPKNLAKIIENNIRLCACDKVMVWNDTTCATVISETFPEMLTHFKSEVKGPYKADICRLAAL